MLAHAVGNGVLQSGGLEVMGNQQYDAYGNPKALNDSYLAKAFKFAHLGNSNQDDNSNKNSLNTTAANNFTYKGEYQDLASNTVYLKARDYDPMSARFLSRDSYDVWNHYSYADSDPVNKIDPSGHMALFFVLSIAFAIGGFISGSTGGGKALTSVLLGASLITGVADLILSYAAGASEMSIEESSEIGNGDSSEEGSNIERGLDENNENSIEDFKEEEKEPEDNIQITISVKNEADAEIEKAAEIISKNNSADVDRDGVGRIAGNFFKKSYEQVYTKEEFVDQVMLKTKLKSEPEFLERVPIKLERITDSEELKIGHQGKYKTIFSNKDLESLNNVDTEMNDMDSFIKESSNNRHVYA